MDKQVVWLYYLDYLKEWVKDHDEDLFYGMSPASFDEWFDNEYSKEDE